MNEKPLSEQLRQIAHDIGVYGNPARFHQMADQALALEAKLEAIRQEASVFLHQAEYLDVSHYDNVPVTFLRLAAQQEGQSE